jgi:hypothetical protein
LSGFAEVPTLIVAGDLDPFALDEAVDQRQAESPMRISASAHCVVANSRREGSSWSFQPTEGFAMGDKSPKSKQRNQKQKDIVKKQDAIDAKNKQAAQGKQGTVKGKP